MYTFKQIIAHKWKFIMLIIFFIINLPQLTWANPVTESFTGTEYYVSKSGSNSGDGSQNNPWGTIQYAVDQLAPNSRLNILPGVYNEKVHVTTSGQPGSPIIIKGQPGSIIDGTGGSVDSQLKVSNVSYITIDGVFVRNTKGHGIYIEGKTGYNSDLKVINSRTEHTDGSGILVEGQWPFVEYRLGNILISNNEVHWPQEGRFNGNNRWQEDITLFGGVENFEVSYNYVNAYRTGPDQYSGGPIGIDVKDAVRNGEVHHNFVENIPSNGLYIDAGWSEARNIKMYNNISKNVSGYGITLGAEAGGGMSDLEVYNNLVINSRYSGFANGDYNDTDNPTQQRTNIDAHNNTIYNSGYGGWGSGSFTQLAHGGKIYDNVIVKSQPEGITAQGSNTTVTGNCISNEVENVTGTGAIVVPFDQAGTIFVDAEGGDFTLASGSPCAGKGADIADVVANAGTGSVGTGYSGSTTGSNGTTIIYVSPPPDADSDGVIDSADNCVSVHNPDQVDQDDDGEGDRCDNDIDGDDVPNIMEIAFGTSQYNADSTPDLASILSADKDGDTYPDTVDAFPEDSSEWADYDKDGIGDNADTDDDNDGVSDTEDAWPKDAGRKYDTDNDGVANINDPDDDGDLFPDVIELQSGTDPLDPDSRPNDEATDENGNGIADIIEIAEGVFDYDGDGFVGLDDKCPYINPGHLDMDGDGKCDAFDDDIDGDGYLNCAYAPGPLCDANDKVFAIKAEEVSGAAWSDGSSGATGQQIAPPQTETLAEAKIRNCDEGFTTTEGGIVNYRGPLCDDDKNTFAALIEMVKRILTYIQGAGIIAAVVIFIYIGFLTLTSGDNAGKRTQASKLLINVLIGLFFIFAAWLIVTYINNELGSDNLDLLKDR